MIQWALSVEPRRTGGLQRELGTVSEKVLIQQLRELERDGVALREVHAQVPQTVAYPLSEPGIALERALRPLGDWGEEHKQAIRTRRTAG